MKKVVQLSDYLYPSEFSQGEENAAKIASQGDTAKIAETHGNKGSPASSGVYPLGKLGVKSKSLKKPVVKLSTHVAPAVAPTPGPEGYKLDCEQMTPGHLHAAYPSEYTSWKDGKSRCKQKGWPWADEWKLFKDFLLSMGPKPSPTHTLDRTDNGLGAYGPGLCTWASKTEQNNNKSDNVKIVIPLTGEVFNAQKIAKMHKVTVKTVYKWNANYYSDLEMIAGKKSKPLHELSVALDELAIFNPKKEKKITYKKIVLAPYKPPEFKKNEWEPTADQYLHYIETGQMLVDSRYEQHRAEYDAIAAWVDGYNNGLPVSPQPPQGRFFKFKRPLYAPLPPYKPTAEHVVSLCSTATSGATADVKSHVEPDYEDEDSDFDPTDCIDPND